MSRWLQCLRLILMNPNNCYVKSNRKYFLKRKGILNIRGVAQIFWHAIGSSTDHQEQQSILYLAVEIQAE